MYRYDFKSSGGIDYIPSLTVDFICFRLLVSLVPAINFLAATYYLCVLIEVFTSKPLVSKHQGGNNGK